MRDGADALAFAARAAALAGVEAEARRPRSRAPWLPACRRTACGWCPRSRCRWPGSCAASCRWASGRLRARGRWSRSRSGRCSRSSAGNSPAAIASRPALVARCVHQRLHVGQQHVARQRGLARAGHAGDGDQALQRHGDVDVLQVVQGGAGDGDPACDFVAVKLGQSPISIAAASWTLGRNWDPTPFRTAPRTPTGRRACSGCFIACSR